MGFFNAPPPTSHPATHYRPITTHPRGGRSVGRWWCSRHILTLYLSASPSPSLHPLSILTFHVALSFVLDEEDLFMVCDLLAGGDLRYHLQQQVRNVESRDRRRIGDNPIGLDNPSAFPLADRLLGGECPPANCRAGSCPRLLAVATSDP